MILYKIKCKDLGFDSCDFVTTGNSESELKRKFFFHSMFDHNKEIEMMVEAQKIEIDDHIKHFLEKQNY